MEFEEYLRRLPRRPHQRRLLSKAKRNILLALWSAGDSFPRNWVDGQTLAERSQQKSYARRIRELRNIRGCDIEMRRVGRASEYRLRSTEILQSTLKAYLTPEQRAELFEASEWTCNACGRDCVDAKHLLEADHRKPLARGGEHKYDNWQALCVDCNVGKRRSCEGCVSDCSGCSWAFPDQRGLNLAVTLPHDVISLLKDNHAQHDWDNVIASALYAHLRAVCCSKTSRVSFSGATLKPKHRR